MRSVNNPVWTIYCYLSFFSISFDIININRAYNETATDIADIVNYHAAPVTVIIGAKASQLEKGANKVWGGLPKDAKVENLEGGAQGLKGAMEFLAMLKKTMHEMTGVPETALGQAQPISNTSGRGSILPLIKIA